MVYCGKPSKGCAPCRSKRTKCDLGLPTCGQCVRTGRLCSGYRLEAYGEFRDQSRDVALKQQTMVQKKRTPFSSTPISPDSTPSRTRENSTELQSFNTSLTAKSLPEAVFSYPEGTAACFFFNDYVLSDLTVSKPLFNELPTMYINAPATSALSYAINALGLASLSNTMRRPEIMMKANAKYAEALTAINSALRDPVEAKNDHTLLVVTLLGMYEEINTTCKSNEPWTNHVKGALALLEYRGTQQLQRQIGLQLISAIRLQVVVNCLVRRVEVPVTLLKWSKLAREYESKDKIAEGEVGDIIAKFCNLQATIDSCHDYIDPVKVVEYASNIDTELGDWAVKWQRDNIFNTVFIHEASPNVFADYWHLYPDIMVASVWNIYRAIRILVNQIIVEQLGRVERSFPTDSILQYSSIYQQQVDASKRIVVELSHEICASIPFYMRHNYYSDKEGWESAYEPKNTARAKLCVWPLYVAGQSDFVSEIMRMWAGHQLIKIGTGMRLGKCIALGHMVRQKQRALPKLWREIGIDD